MLWLRVVTGVGALPSCFILSDSAGVATTCLFGDVVHLILYCQSVAYKFRFDYEVAYRVIQRDGRPACCRCIELAGPFW